MKKLTMLTLAILMVALSAPIVMAQGDPNANITWSSAYQVQNLASTDATVTITYYEQGSDTTYAGNTTVPGDGSVTIFPFVLNDDVASGPETFNGSAVLSSDQPIAAILNTQSSSSPFYGASTLGFTEGATSLSLPLIACNNAGFDTWFNIQNVGSSDANVTVNYVAGSAGVNATDTVVIPPYQAKTFDQNANTSLGTKTCTDLADTTSDKFVGGATVSSDQPVVASVMFLGTGSIPAVQGYNGFTGGSTSVNLPLIMANNSSFYTSIQIQNAGVSDTTITIAYGANTSTGGDPVSEDWDIPAGGSVTVLNLGGVSAYSKNDWTTVGKYVGSATITQTGSEPLVAILNQNSTSFTSLGSTYEGFDPAMGSQKISLPLVAANNSGYLTGIQIMAIEDGTSVTLTYSENSIEAGEVPTADTFTLDAGESKTLIQNGAPGELSGVNNWDDIGKYVGSGTVTADGPVLAIVNFNGPATGDTFFTYDGINQ